MQKINELNVCLKLTATYTIYNIQNLKLQKEEKTKGVAVIRETLVVAEKINEKQFIVNSKEKAITGKEVKKNGKTKTS